MHATNMHRNLQQGEAPGDDNALAPESTAQDALRDADVKALIQWTHSNLNGVRTTLPIKHMVRHSDETLPTHW